MDETPVGHSVTDRPRAQTHEEWELEALNANLHANMDWGAVKEIMEGFPTGAVVKRWRLSIGLSGKTLGLSLHYSRRHIMRIEMGHWPMNEHFLKQLRPFVALIAKGIPYIPPSVDNNHYPMPADLRELGKISKSRIAGEAVFRECPGCHQKYWYTNPRKIYHSKRCKDRAARRGESAGERDRGSKPARMLFTRCPACGDIHPVKGSLVAQPASTDPLLRGDPPASDGQAAPDAERQVEAAAVSGEEPPDERSAAPGLQLNDEVLASDRPELGSYIPYDYRQ